jgi:hypothetical protein
MVSQRKSNFIPTSRSDWANLNWMEAQKLIGLILNHSGFMKFEERKISKSNRADVIVIRQTKTRVIIGVVEVKSYQKISEKIAQEAMIQTCRYIQTIYELFNNRWGNKSKQYFGVVVFTKDYPNILHRTDLDAYGSQLPFDLLNNNSIDLFTCVPENLLKLLQLKGIAGPIQDSLEDYYQP